MTLLATNLDKGLGPDAGAHFEDRCCPPLQEAHVAPEDPALRIGTGLQGERGEGVGEKKGQIWFCSELPSC